MNWLVLWSSLLPSKPRAFSWIIAMLAASSAACTADLLPEPDAGAVVQRPPVTAAAPPTPEAGPSEAQPPAPDAAAPAIDASAWQPASPDSGASEQGASDDLGEHSDAQSDADEDDAGTRAAPPPPEPGGPVAPTPIHRYDFSGSGTRVSDALGTAHGQLLGGASLAQGAVELDGSDDYVALPAGLLSGLKDVTLLVWLRWDGGECWQRVLDFGDVGETERGEDRVGSSLCLVASSCPEGSPAVVVIDDPLGAKESTVAMSALVPASMIQLGVSFASETGRIQLIADGVVVAERASRLRLDQLRDVNAWLGRSLYANDPYLQGQLSELRIYDQALDGPTLARTFARGPDAL